MMGCKSILKNISSVIDHLNNIHRVPRGENLRNMTRHAQKTFIFVKEEGRERFNITMLHFPNMKGKNDDKKVLYSCPVPDCVGKFRYPKTSLQLISRIYTR